MGAKPPGYFNNINSLRNKITTLKGDPLIWLIGFIAAIVGATWNLCMELNVKPRDHYISQLISRISLEDEVRALRTDLKELRSSNTDLKNILKIPAVEEIGQLDITRVLYQAPGGKKVAAVTQGQVVHSGGKIWFELQLPEAGGYLLAFLEDHSGKKFNLFPGTERAVMKGYYRVPEHLYNPKTQVQEFAVKNADTHRLTSRKIMIGGYIFDETKGDETFHFYYLGKRNSIFESFLRGAEDIGKDLPQMRGVENIVSGFGPEAVNKTIDKPIFYRNDLKLIFKHD